MLRTVRLPLHHNRGELFLCSMPGRFESLETFVSEAGDMAVRHILCLVSLDEIGRKSPRYLAAIQADELSPITLWHHVIPDYGLPEDPDTLENTLDQLIHKLNQGESLVIHCAAGHGRTGMVAVLLLVRLGVRLDEATRIIGLAGSAPDTPEQMDWICVRKKTFRESSSD